jgi:hypothetical protein
MSARSFPFRPHFWLAAACWLAMLVGGSEARAQVPYFGVDWFNMPWTTEWVSQYWTELEESDDDTRLASIPDMFGDSFARGGVLTATNLTLPAVTNSSDVLLAGGSRGLKVGEHNKALPQDRVYFVYNHFHNATSTEIVSPLVPPTTVYSATAPIDRYTLGFEKRFADDLWSVEMRMPFTGDLDLSDSLGVAENHGGQYGNLSLILKRLLYYDAATSIVAGLGVETPTGSDFFSRTANVNYTVSNDAVHLHPYVGMLHAPCDCVFYHGFIQLDVPTHGNLVTFDAAGGPSGTLGRYNDQTLLYIDAGVGYWLYRDPCACTLTGLATLLEVHYTDTLTNTDVVSGSAGSPDQTFRIANPAGWMNVVNLTAAVHAQLANTTNLRIGGVFPLTQGNDRFFDAEVTVQVIRQF